MLLLFRQTFDSSVVTLNGSGRGDDQPIKTSLWLRVHQQIPQVGLISFFDFVLLSSFLYLYVIPNNIRYKSFICLHYRMFTDISLAEDLNTKFSDFLKSSNVDVSTSTLFTFFNMDNFLYLPSVFLLNKFACYSHVLFSIGWYQLLRKSFTTRCVASKSKHYLPTCYSRWIGKDCTNGKWD